MKKLLFLCAVVAATTSFAQSNVHVQDNRVAKTFLDNKKTLDKTYQYQLMKAQPWSDYKAAHPGWYVWFNEENAKPHRAYGSPIPSPGATPEDKAMNFINNKLGDFNIPTADLRLQGVAKNDKMTFVNYYQEFDGLRVLYSNMTVRLSNAGDVIMWGADVFNDISLNIAPAIDAAGIEAYASTGIPTPVENVVVKPGVVVLPMPDPVYTHKNIYKLVYEVNVHTTETNGIPANWYTLVDANTGEVYYRHNEVYTCGLEHDHEEDCTPKDKKDLKNKIAAAKIAAADIELTVQGTVYPTDPADPTAVVNLANIDLTVGGTGYTLDGNGYVLTTETGSQTAVIPLEGAWCKIVDDGSGITPSMTVTVDDVAPNVLSVDGDANIAERSAYNNVNVIHDYMKSILPTFTGMDWQLPTNVEINPHECNAFYNGSSINFYSDNVDCSSLAKVNDVVFHEYGHGINYEFYNSNGLGFFQNGAMGEGYADVWGYAEFEDPLLGDGHNPTDLTAVIRRYDIDPKVYPGDIVGEVHADGEIIAGAWWDLYLNLGNDMPGMMSLFADAYLGGQATNADGNEGQAYTEVLLDCLLADDTDADISNGTPNDAAIVDAFRIHGITLISNAVLTHSPLEAHTPSVGIDVSADLTLGLPWSDYLDDVKCVYQLNDNGIWDTIPMTNTSGSTWDGQIPAQPAGTIVSYYVGAEDVNGVLSAVQPIQANDTDPNLPYYILVGFDLEGQEDGDFVSSLGNWNTIASDDNATTGIWSWTSPVGSYSDLNGDGSGDVTDPDAICAPTSQHTTGGTVCLVTGQSTSVTDGIGVNDVDGGKTTVYSDPIDMSMYTNPAFSYWRWYTNAPAGGANPNADWWQTYMSNDGGASWVFIEETKVSERNWRRKAFRINDYLPATNQMMFRMVVSDSIRPGQNLDGGSLIEGALDDLQLWDETFVSVGEIDGISGFNAYPNPADNVVNLSFFAKEAKEDLEIEITNHLGQIVYREVIGSASNSFVKQIDVSGLASGLYHVSLKSEGNQNSVKLSIQ